MAAAKMDEPASALRGRPGRPVPAGWGALPGTSSMIWLGITRHLAAFICTVYETYRIVFGLSHRDGGRAVTEVGVVRTGVATTDAGRPAAHEDRREPLSVGDAGPGPASHEVPDVARPIHSRLGLVVILTAAFMVVLDFSIVNVALASIQHQLGFGASSVEWVVTGYAITFGGLLVLGGRAADLLGRRRLFIAGLILFTLASLAGGLAQSAALLVAARLVQGVGAAMVAPAALSLITTGFPEGAERSRALGAYGAVSSLGFVSGQVLGGVLVEFTSWRSVFLVNVPVGLVAAWAAHRLLSEPAPAKRAHRLDVGGAALITAAIALLVYAVSEAGISGVTAPAVVFSLAGAGLAAAGFLAVEHRHPDPLVPPRLLAFPSLRSASLLMALVGLWNGGELIVLSLYLQEVLHRSPLASGLIIAPQGVVGFTAGVMGARLIKRLGLQRLTLATGLAATIGFLFLTQLPYHGAYSPALAAVTLVGFGTAGSAFAAMVGASSGMDDTDQGFVGGAINTSRQIGAAVGAALMPAVAEAVNGAGHLGGASGDRAAMLVGALAAAAAVLASLRLSTIYGSGHARPLRHRLLRL